MPANRRQINTTEITEITETTEIIKNAEITETTESTEIKPTIQDIFANSIAEFEGTGDLHEYNMTADDFEIEYLPEPHAPKPLPKGKQAVYVFYHNSKCLYIGYAGAKSSSRFYSQHYNVKSNDGTLAGYLLKDGVSNLHNIKPWIKANCWRVNIYIDSTHNTAVLKKLRDFLKSEYKPTYGI